jgi:hypothetical protein
MTVSDDLAGLPFLESTICPSFRRKSSKPGNSGKGISKFMAENGHIDLSSHASGGMRSTLCKLSKRAHPVQFLAFVALSVDQLTSVDCRQGSPLCLQLHFPWCFLAQLFAAQLRCL